MAGRFVLTPFTMIDVDDPFFDSLKRDYPGTKNSTGFLSWFEKKRKTGSDALIFEDEDGIGAFVYVKEEQEEIQLCDQVLPRLDRIKIGTLKLSERYQNQRIGEGAIGLILWNWQRSRKSEIYVTIFEKQRALIALLERFGFLLAGTNLNGEKVYLRCRDKVDFNDPYKSFPFISSNTKGARYIIVNDIYHDTLFPYSELKNTLQESVAISAANGMTKVYVGAQPFPKYKVGEPVLVYRRHTQGSGARYKSCLTSYCVVTKVIVAKRFDNCLISFDELLSKIGNKSVFDRSDLEKQYKNNKHLSVIELLYYGYFGSGNNINMEWLENNGYWAGKNQYPTDIELSMQQFIDLLKEGEVDVQNVVID